MNNGDDTAYYLSRGFDVVALDANPALCESAQETVSRGDRRRPPDDSSTLQSGTRPEKRHFTSTSTTIIGAVSTSAGPRREDSRYREITVRCVTLASLFEEFGAPHYLKIDVEGVDHSVLEQLRGSSLLPLYISVEDCRFGFQYLDTLAACGYNGFKLLDQSTVRHMTDPATGRIFQPDHRARSATTCRARGGPTPRS